MPATSRMRMGLPIERLVIATNVNDILARTLATGTYELRDVVRDLLAVDGHPGVVEFRAAVVRRLWPRRARRARADGLAGAVAAVLAVGSALVARSARSSPPTAPTRTRPPRPSARCCARPARFIDPHTAVGVAVAEKETRDPAVPMVVLAHRACGEVPRCGRGRLRRAPAAARLARRSQRAAGARRPRCRPIRPRSSAISCRQAAPHAKEPPHERRSHASALRSRGRDRRDAASANAPRSASGSAPAAATSGRTSTAFRICSSTWRSRAPRAAPRGRSPRRSRRSAAISTRRPASRPPPITRACSRPTCRSRSTCLSDILADPTFDPEELQREQNVIVQEIGAAEDTPDDLVVRLAAGDRVSGPAGRPLDPRHAATTVRSFDRTRLARLSRAQLSRARHGGGGRRRGRSRGGGRARSSGGSRASPARPRRRRSRARFVGGSRIETRDLEQVHVALAHAGLPQRDPDLFSLQVFTNVLGGGMSSRLFQEVREIRGLCYAIYAFHAPYSDTGMFGLYAGTDAADLPELMRVVVDEIAQRGRDHHRGRDRARQGADEGRAADGARKLRRARRAARAADDDLGPADPARTSWSARSRAVTVESARAPGAR